MYTILVVDDEKDIVSALEIYLKAEGYRVLSACNGKEALAAAAREDVHLILMDIMMPVMDGLSAMASAAADQQRTCDPADRQGRGHRQGPGAERGRGRLYHQALQPGGAAGPGTLTAAAVFCSWAAGRCRPARSSSAASAWMTTPRPSPWTATRWR